MYLISKSWRFSAAHHLPNLPDGHKCRRVHGHSYRVELVLRAEAVDEYGMVVDYGVLDGAFGAFISEMLDHRDLNTVLHFQPTAENLARHLYRKAQGFWPATHAVRVHESDSTWAEYSE